MAKKLTYDKCIVFVTRPKKQNAIFEKIEILEQVSLTEKEVEDLNKQSAQNGIRYYLPEEEANFDEDGLPSDYNKEGYDREGYNVAGEYNAKHDKSL